MSQVSIPRSHGLACVGPVCRRQPGQATVHTRQIRGKNGRIKYSTTVGSDTPVGGHGYAGRVVAPGRDLRRSDLYGYRSHGCGLFYAL